MQVARKIVPVMNRFTHVAENPPSARTPGEESARVRILYMIVVCRNASGRNFLGKHLISVTSTYVGGLRVRCIWGISLAFQIPKEPLIPMYSRLLQTTEYAIAIQGKRATFRPRQNPHLLAGLQSY